MSAWLGAVARHHLTFRSSSALRCASRDDLVLAFQCVSYARYLTCILGHLIGRPRLRGVFEEYERFYVSSWLTMLVGFAPLLGRNMAQVVAHERRLPSQHSSSRRRRVVVVVWSFPCVTSVPFRPLAFGSSVASYRRRRRRSSWSSLASVLRQGIVEFRRPSSPPSSSSSSSLRGVRRRLRRRRSLSLS